MSGDKITRLRASLDRGEADPRNHMLFARALREAIDALELSPWRLGEAFGISQTTLRAWQSGRVAPPEATRAAVLLSIREALDEWQAKAAEPTAGKPAGKGRKGR